jgi:hypothetical protein
VEEEEEEEDDVLTASGWLWNGKAGGATAEDGVEGFKLRIQAQSKGRSAAKTKEGEGDAVDSRREVKKTRGPPG